MPGIVETDYYRELGLTRSATDIDVKKAFRKLALACHPDADPTPAAHTQFVRACEAYDVLSNPERKGLYDLLGESALKQGVPDGAGGTTGGSYSFNIEMGPDEVFARFFGTLNPYEALQGISSSFEQMTTPKKPAPGKKKTYDFFLTLEEVYHGVMKQVTHTRRVLQPDGATEVQERELTIDVKPGLPDGTQFVFQREGNQTPATEPGPVVFVLRSEKHPRFSRRGADLLHTATIPLNEALTGTSLPVLMLDGRMLDVPVADIITPGYTMSIPREGFPKPGGGKGNLVITYEIKFPSALSEHQRVMLRAGFFLPHKLDPQQAKAVKAFETAFRHETHGWSQGFAKHQNTPLN